MRRVLDVIYDAAVAPDRWPAVLAELATLFHGSFVDIFTRTHDRRHFGGLAHGLDRSDYEDQFLGVWFNRNVWGIAKPVRVAGEVLSSRNIVDVDQLTRSEIYNEYLEPRDLHEGLRLSLWAGEREIQDISILRPWSAGAFGPADVALGEVLLPHLQRAAAVTRRLRQADLSLETGPSASNAANVAVIVFDVSGVPFWFNAAAERVLSQGDALKLLGAELHAGTPAVTRTLRTAIARAAGLAGLVRQTGTVRLPRLGGATALTLVTLPMSNATDWAMSRPPAAMALLRDTTAVSVDRERLEGLFGLTSAEAELAQHLLAGLTLREIASRRVRSLHTIRNHLARLMIKTDTNKQGDLVRLLTDVASLGTGQPVDGPSPAVLLTGAVASRRT